MARPGRPERNRAARSFRQLRRFDHVINSDKGGFRYTQALALNAPLPGLRQTENGAVTSAVSGAPTRGTGPLRLALAGATRTGSAGVGSRGPRTPGRATPPLRGGN